MKLFTLASTIAAFSLLKQVDSATEYPCAGHTFPASYIHQVAQHAWTVDIQSRGGFPCSVSFVPQSSRYGPARQYPLLPSHEIWQSISYTSLLSTKS
ncbi:putative secreted effector protein [Blumeria graminis f. sp. tritici 96224]|uniref:Putative secreted effector protein n=1 Tax=Blumeria graminis f. sp. tritici 96224 TaxID=1268274 RepID=A0A656KGI6_BLUGR|nr:putative secreted effector protein [Blumeria graminis f. sp. tritici 96224]